MRWHYLQHVPFEGPAHLASWARSRGHSLAGTEVWTGVSLPRLDRFDGLFILGGPMNVYEEDRYPWLVGEKELIGGAIAANKAALGVCLGAQLLSVVLGGTVTKNPRKEIGWFPVELTAAGREHPLLGGFPGRFTAFHWHGDRFTIPPGAAHVARTEVCEEQGLVYGDRVVGLQFHLESTEESVGALIEHCRDEITPAPYIQDPSAMRGQAAHQRDAHALLDKLLDGLLAAG